MTPNEIAKSNTEDAHQAALFAWAAVAKNYGFEVANAWATGMGFEAAKSSHSCSEPIAELEWLHHIPNGGSRGDDAKSRMIRGSQLKRQGVKSGIPDIFLPGPPASSNGPNWIGLYIEMKAPSLRPKTICYDTLNSPGLSEEQKRFLDFARRRDYSVHVCYSWRDAANVVQAYLQGRLRRC